MEGGSPTIVTNAEGGRTTPSVVAYAKNGDRLVGQVRAKRVSSLFIHRRVASERREASFFDVWAFGRRGTTGAPMKKKRVDSAPRVLAASALASERHLPFASSSRDFSDPEPTTPV
jgi:hypothetical protein